MAQSRFALWLSCILIATCVAESAAQPGWHRLVSVTPGNAESLNFASGVTPYRYKTSEISENELAANAPARAILFGEEMIFTFLRAKPATDYQIRAVFLSDSAERVEKIQIAGSCSDVEERIALPSHIATNRTWSFRTPEECYETLQVTVSKIAGPNAVISSLEVWSADSGTLKSLPPIQEMLAEINLAPPSLSPRPAIVSSLNKTQISLNGTWKFTPKPQPYPQMVDSIITAKWKNISVPGEWAAQGFTVLPDDCACYWREFNIPAEWAGHQLKLRFDTVHSDCRVWVNGSLVGAHEGCFIPFELDITDVARTGRNAIIVAVRNESLADRLASATAYAGHALGGITRKVTLFAVPKVNLAAQSVSTRFDANYRNATLNVHIELANQSTRDAHSQVSFQLIDPQDLPVPINPLSPSAEMPLDTVLRTIRAGQTVTQDVAIRVAAPAQWDTEHPNLYTLRTELKTGGLESEVVTQRVGFRQIEIRGARVFVNNHPIKLHGVCRHESHPLFGRSLNTELWRKDAEMFRAANVNYIRTSHYPPPEEFLDLCDELGLFVECEAPLCWVNSSSAIPDFMVLARANLANVAANRNHPSIIIWSLANESTWSPLFADVQRRVKQLDPSRPTSFHDQSWGTIAPGGSTADIANFHYPDTNGPAKCDGGARPVLFGEYCHLQTYNHSEGLTDPGVRDQWGPRFGDMFESMYRHDGNLGGALWSGIDDVFDLPDGQVEGYGFWGVIDGWRREKPETFHVRKVYSPIRVTTRELEPGTGPFAIALENRYNFADLNEVKIQWSLGRERGVAVASARPRTSGELKVGAGVNAKAGQTLRLQFTDPRSFICEEVELPVGKTEAPRTWPLKAGKLALQTNSAAIIVTGEKFSIEIDRQSGMIKSAIVNERPVLTGGPVLMALPIEDGPCKPQDLTQFHFSNATCADWTARAVEASIEQDGSVLVRCEGEYADFNGCWAMHVSASGALAIDYDFVTRKDLNPRQAGLVFYVDPKCDTLHWQRQAPWSVYPETHIGRPVGSAKANPNSAMHTVHLDRAPDHPWSADSTALGTADFRSTKANILLAELRGGGRGVAVNSDARQSVRAFVDGARIGWLIAGVNTGGGEPFFRPHSAVDRKPLKAGDHLKDSIQLQLSQF